MAEESTSLEAPIQDNPVVETSPILIPEQRRQDGAYLSIYSFLGLGATDMGSMGVHDAIDGLPQVRDMHSISSPISGEKDQPSIQGMALQMNETLKSFESDTDTENPRELLIFMNSFGALYGGIVLDEMIKQERELVQRNIKKIRIMFSGPLVSEGVRGVRKLIERTKNLAGAQLVKGYNESNATPLGGMEALRYVPVSDGEVMNSNLRAIFPERSHVAADAGNPQAVDRINMITDTSILDAIPEEHKPRLLELQSTLRSQISSWQEWDQWKSDSEVPNEVAEEVPWMKKEIAKIYVEKALKELATFVQPYVAQGYDGAYRGYTPDQAKERTNIERGVGMIAQGFVHAWSDKLRLVGALISGHTTKLMDELVKMGMNPDQSTIYLPEWDTAFFGPEEAKHLKDLLTVNGVSPKIIFGTGDVHSQGQAAREATEVAEAINRVAPPREKRGT